MRSGQPKVFACATCGSLVKRWHIGAGLCRSCSQRQNSAKRGPYVRHGKALRCVSCGKQFYAPLGEIARGRQFCSKRCSKLQEPKKCCVCGKDILWGGKRRMLRKTCSHRCAHIATGRAKRGPRNPNYRNGNGEGRRLWLATKEPHCRCCGTTSRLHLHHVIYEQHVKREGGDIFDPRNGYTCCFECHMGHHHNTDRRIVFSTLRPENIEFAHELLGRDRAAMYFVRHYEGVVLGDRTALLEVAA